MDKSADNIDMLLNGGLSDIDGYMSPQSPTLFFYCHRLQEQFDVRGSLVEIGVFKGKSLLVMDALVREGESLLAIDIFDSSVKKGRSEREELRLAAERNIEQHAINKDKIILKARDSLRMSGRDIVDIIEEKARLIHIDGNHRMPYVLHDLELAAECLADGGIVVLDDFFIITWSEVTEAYFRYVHSGRNTIAPFAFGFGKLYLCGITHQKTYHAEFKNLAREKFMVMPSVLSGHNISFLREK